MRIAGLEKLAAALTALSLLPAFHVERFQEVLVHAQLNRPFFSPANHFQVRKQAHKRSQPVGHSNWSLAELLRCLTSWNDTGVTKCKAKPLHLAVEARQCNFYMLGKHDLGENRFCYVYKWLR